MPGKGLTKSQRQRGRTGTEPGVWGLGQSSFLSHRAGVLDVGCSEIEAGGGCTVSGRKVSVVCLPDATSPWDAEQLLPVHTKYPRCRVIRSESWQGNSPCSVHIFVPLCTNIAFLCVGCLYLLSLANSCSTCRHLPDSACPLGSCVSLNS